MPADGSANIIPYKWQPGEGRRELPGHERKRRRKRQGFMDVLERKLHKEIWIEIDDQSNFPRVARMSRAEVVAEVFIRLLEAGDIVAFKLLFDKCPNFLGIPDEDDTDGDPEEAQVESALDDEQRAARGVRIAAALKELGALPDAPGPIIDMEPGE